LEISTDPVIIISQKDDKCFEKLKELDLLEVNIPRNKTEIDNTPISPPSSELSEPNELILKHSVNQSYKQYQAQERLKDFYKDLPSILRNEHNQLINRLKKESDQRKNEIESHLNALQNEIEKINASLMNHQFKTSLPESLTDFDFLQNLGLQEELLFLEKKLRDQEIHEGLPNVAGVKIPFHGGREKSKNAEISDDRNRSLHKEILDYAEKFKSQGSDQYEKQLIHEAKDLRVNNNSVLPLTERVEAFELKHIYIKNQKDFLDEKIRSTSEIEKRKNLEIAEGVSITLIDNSRKIFYSGDLSEGEHWADVAKEVIDFSLGLIPVASTGKDILEALTGKNFITGTTLLPWERTLCAASVFTLGSGTIAKSGIKLFDKISSFLVSSKKISNADILSKDLIFKESSLFRVFKEKNWISGEKLNQQFLKETGIPPSKFFPPWKGDRRVLEFVTDKEITMYRIFSDEIANETKESLSKKSGRWFSRMNPEEFSDKNKLRDLLSLPPDNNLGNIMTIKVPPGTKMRMGVVAGSEKIGTKGGGIQYDLINTSINERWIQ